jgi:hypothetical protein
MNKTLRAGAILVATVLSWLTITPAAAIAESELDISNPAAVVGRMGNLPPTSRALSSPKEPADSRTVAELSVGAKASPEQDASRQAATTNKSVIVDARTTPTEQITALPDGNFSKTVSVEPSRMLANGKWTDISTDLVEVDGVLKPEMVPADLTLSKGGTGKLSSVSDGQGHSVTESWPYGTLPAAQVDGDTATYPSVFPGVDLIQIAKKQGISQVLKIYTPQAAQDPRVVDFKLKLNAENVALGSDGKGGLKGTSKKTGDEVLRSASGRWWDSRHEGARAADPGGPGIVGSFDLALEDSAGAVHEKLRISDVLSRKDLTYPLYIDPD